MDCSEFCDLNPLEQVKTIINDASPEDREKILSYIMLEYIIL